MTKTASTTSSDRTTAGDPMNFGVDRVADAGQKSMLAAAHLHTRLMRNALEVNAELLDFASRRVREDISTNERLARCTSLTDAMEVMSGFYQNAFKEYAEEAEKIARIGTDATRRSIEETQAEANEIAQG